MNKKKRRRRVLLAAGAAFLASFPFAIWSCFPGPLRDRWPPKPGEPRHRIDVAYRDWHTIIVIPGEAPPASFQEWEFCEKAWYLEGKQGFLGIPGAIRALCWPTTSGVGCETNAAPPWSRFPAEEVDRWSFVLSEKGLRALQAYLESQKGAAFPEFPGWYEGKRSYHLFFHCHHFTASALREAGLPIRPWWAFAGWMAKIQLNRIRRFHEEEGLGRE